MRIETEEFAYVKAQAPPAGKRALIPRGKRSDDEEYMLHGLALRAAICAIGVLMLFAVKVNGTEATVTEPQPAAPAAAQVAASELDEYDSIDDIGRLQFADGADASTGFDVGDVVMPVSGSISQTFDGRESFGLTFDTSPGSGVVSATDGLVCEVTALEVRVGMEDGVIVCYRGVTPVAEIGDYVDAGDSLGTAVGTEVTLNVLRDDVAVDPLTILTN